jgi:hypothetical protein
MIASSVFSYIAGFVARPRIQARVIISICGEPVPLPNHTTPFARAYGDLLIVEKRGMKLGEFLNYREQILNASCIYDYCNGMNRCPDPEPDWLKLWVNGVERFEFERYVVRNGDEIVIDYSSGRLPGEGLEEIRIIPK